MRPKNADSNGNQRGRVLIRTANISNEDSLLNTPSGFFVERKHDDQFNRRGNILISDQFNNRVIETNERGEIIWVYGKGPLDFTPDSIIGVNDAERIGENTLMAGTGTPGGVIPQVPTGVADNRVILVDKRGRIIWQYGQFGMAGSGYNLLNSPVQVTFIPNSHSREKCHNHSDDSRHQCHNSGYYVERHHHSDEHHSKHTGGGVLHGNVLITDQGNNRIIEVHENKRIVWQYPGPNTNSANQLRNPNSAEKLENGNILIADQGNNRAIEVNRRHEVVRTFTANGTLGACAFASRLENGNTLLTDAGNNRVVEVNCHDAIVWQYITNAESQSINDPAPTRALRLLNGDTLISDQFNNRVIRVNRTAVIVDYYGLPLNGSSGSIGTNSGYDLNTTQLGLYGPYDAKIIGTYIGITPAGSF